MRPVERCGVIEGCHLTCEGDGLVLRLARLARDSPACVGHGLKGLAGKEQPAKLLGSLGRDASLRKLGACMLYQLQVGIGALVQLGHAEELALPAENLLVVATATHVVKERLHAVVVSPSGIEPAGRDHHGALALHVVAGGMAAVAHVVDTLLHKGQGHGQLPVDEVLERSRHRKVVEREAPNGDVGPHAIGNDLRHIVTQAAGAILASPTLEAAQAGTDAGLARLNGPYLNGSFAQLLGNS